MNLTRIGFPFTTNAGRTYRAVPSRPHRICQTAACLGVTLVALNALGSLPLSATEIPKSKPHSRKKPGVVDSPDATLGMQKVLLLQAGLKIQLRVTPRTQIPRVHTGGRWKAEYGDITQTGLYTAPAYTPIDGLDTVTYSDVENRNVQLTVRILPNPHISGSEQTPYLIAPWATGGKSLSSPPGQPHVPKGKPIMVLEPGEKAPPPRVYGNVRLIAPEKRGHDVIYPLPVVIDGIVRARVIYVQKGKSDSFLNEGELLPGPLTDEDFKQLAS